MSLLNNGTNRYSTYGPLLLPLNRNGSNHIDSVIKAETENGLAKALELGFTEIHADRVNSRVATTDTGKVKMSDSDKVSLYTKYDSDSFIQYMETKSLDSIGGETDVESIMTNETENEKRKSGQTPYEEYNKDSGVSGTETASAASPGNEYITKGLYTL